MIRVTDRIALDEGELQFRFITAPGPGGQHVNKAATAVQLRFDVRRSPSLTEEVRARLTALAGSRLNQEGVLILEASASRSQAANRRAVIERLVDLIRQASVPPKTRRPTRTPRAAKERRLQEKKRRAARKRERRPPSPEDER